MICCYKKSLNCNKVVKWRAYPTFVIVQIGSKFPNYYHFLALNVLVLPDLNAHFNLD